MTTEAGTAQAVEDELKDVDLSDVEPVKVKKTKKAKHVKAETKKKVVAKKETKKAKAEKKPAKQAKAKKAKEEDEDAPPKNFPGGIWPFKKGSAMLYCFQKALEGVKAVDLQKEVEHPDGPKSEGYSWKTMLKALADGRRTRSFATHSWKLHQEGGRLKIYDVKFLGLPKREKKEGKTTKKAEAKTKTKAKAKSKAKAKKAA